MKTSRDERGMALVIALLILLVLSGLASALLLGVHSDTKVAGHSVRASQALYRAEAGIAEAQERMRLGDVPDNRDPRMVAQIFLCQPGSVPAVGPDTVALATGQPAGEWLDYSRPTQGPEVLRVEYRTDAARNIIFHYDPTVSPAIQTQTGPPIFVVTSTGRKGDDQRSIVTEVIPWPFLCNAKGAFTAGVDVTLSGSSVVCGYNHRADTPVNTGDHGRTGIGGCNEDPANHRWETGTGDRAGVWSSDHITDNGNGNLQEGTPPTIDGQSGFYAGPWDAIGMTKAEYFNWMGAPSTSVPNPPIGILYLDNDGTQQNQSGGWSCQGGDGEGFLYVDGDLTINGNFSFRGMVYVEGDLKITGNAWILGGVVCRGKTEIKLANGNFTVLYSSDAVDYGLSKYGGRFVSLSWRELD